MGRHSSAKNNNSLSGGAIIAVIAVIALVVAGLWWFLSDRGAQTDAADPASSGRDCTLVPVAADDEELARTLLAGWGDPDADNCIEAEYTDNLDEAAVFVGPDSPRIDDTLVEAGRNIEGGMTPVASVPVGLSGPESVIVDEVEAADVDFGDERQPEAAVLVADALGVGADDLRAPGGEFTATAESHSPDGETFTSVEGSQLVHFARVLATNGSVSEQQVDAAGQLTETASEMYDGPAASPEVPEELWAVATAPQQPEEEAAGETAAEAEKPQDDPAPQLAENTLFLLDTSDAIGPFHDAAAAAVGDAAVAATGDGSLAALWNYSSPLNPGVTQGWRENLNFTASGEDIRRSAQLFGTGGQPQTRSAVEAALGHAAATDGASRVVVITTGTVDDQRPVPDLPEGVELSVIHVGDGAVDEDLAKAATYHAQVTNASALGGEVAEATGL